MGGVTFTSDGNQPAALNPTQAMISEPNLNKKIQSWKVAIVEDADDLHLATKPMSATVVSQILGDDLLGRLFEDTALGGSDRRQSLLRAVTKAMGPNPPPVATQRN